MKSITTHKAYLVFMLVLSVFVSSSLVYAGSNKQVNDHKKPGTKSSVALGAAASFGVFGGGAGMTNQGIYTVVNGDIGTTAASTLVTEFHDRSAVYTESTLNIGNVTGKVYTATAPKGSVPNEKALRSRLTHRPHMTICLPQHSPAGLMSPHWVATPDN